MLQTIKKRTFSELVVGQTAEAMRIVTEDMVMAFAKVSLDYNPIHLDEVYAATTPFKSRIAHGALITSFVSGLIGMELPGPGTVAIALNLKFRKPVYMNQAVITKVVITEIDNRRGFITLACACYVEGSPVIKGEALVNFPLGE
ncbi:MAG: MaoC family dehydratase [Candidatus Paceibacterota bacterium]|jgi:3-hydroxybutyryl-CoA dehydratase